MCNGGVQRGRRVTVSKKTGDRVEGVEERPRALCTGCRASGHVRRRGFAALLVRHADEVRLGVGERLVCVAVLSQRSVLPLDGLSTAGREQGRGSGQLGAKRRRERGGAEAHRFETVVRVWSLDDAPQETVVANDDDVLLLAVADEPADPLCARDVLLLCGPEDALVAVPLCVALDLGPVEPRLREPLLGFREGGARVAREGAALLQLREDDDGDGVRVGGRGEEGREAEEHGLEGAAERGHEDDRVGGVQGREERWVRRGDRDALRHASLMSGSSGHRSAVCHTKTRQSRDQSAEG